MKKLMLNFA